MAGEKTVQRKDRRIVIENVRRMLLQEYLMKQTQRAGFGGLDIQRTPMGTRVTLIAERPGLVIGRKGAAIKALTDAVDRQFNFDNPQIEVQEVASPSLNAQIMAEKLANALERGWHFRRAGHSTVRRIMEAGAKGCLVVIAGKLTGQRHRRAKFKAGHIKYCGEPRNTWMRKGFAVAKLKPGVIGVTVQISIKTPTAEWLAASEAARAAEAAAAAQAASPPVPVLDTSLLEEGGVPAGLTDAPLSELIVEEKAPEKVKASKKAEKKLKKVLKEVKELGEEVDLEVEVKEEKK